MKQAVAIFAALSFSVALPAAQQAATQQSQTIQMQCRDFGPSGSYLGPNETLVNGRACHPVATSQPAATITASNSFPTTPARAAAAAHPVPTEAGMYITAADGDVTKILGQIVDFQRTGSLLASKATLGVKTRKENVQLLGAHAQTVAGTAPEFYFLPAKQEADAGVNAGDLILVRLEEKKERRQFEVGAEGAWRGSKGISLTHQVQLSRSEVKEGVYKIAPSEPLTRGEYGLYLSRGEGMSPYIYDFSVQ